MDYDLRSADSLVCAIKWCMRIKYLTSCRTLETASRSPRSSLMMDGGEALDSPVPTMSHFLCWKASTTFLPRRPDAPVMRTFFDMVMVVVWCFVEEV